MRRSNFRPRSIYSWTSSISVPKAVFGCTNATVVPRDPGRGCFVDHAVAVLLHRVERGGDVVDAVADVVQPFALAREVLRHRRVVTYRREQLDVRVGDLQQRFFDAVLLDDLAVLDLTAVRGPVVVDRAFEVVDGDGDVVDLGEQGASLRAATGPGELLRSRDAGTT